MGARGESLRRPRGVAGVGRLSTRRAWLALALVVACVPSMAHAKRAPLASGDRAFVQECREGGDFIRNAARSRDNGMSRDAFLGRLRDDFLVVRGFRPELRWFVHGPEDERFLETEVMRVFDAPEDPEQHRAAFVPLCLRRAPPASH